MTPPPTGYGYTPARPWATLARPDATLARDVVSPTPAQVTGHPDFVTDVPVQGPTDPGMRAGSCWWAQNVLSNANHCVDCQQKGNVMVPGWSRSSMACPGCGMLGESVSFGGRRAAAFSLSAPGDPDVFATLTPAQQAWIGSTLVTLNTNIMQASGTTCPTWGPSVPQAAGCFQAWYNANYAPANGPSKQLRTDGVVDLDTLNALQMIAGLHPTDFPTPYPATPAPLANPPLANPTPVPAPSPAPASKGLSTGAIVGIGAAGAAVLGGIVYAATRKPSGRRRRR